MVHHNYVVEERLWNGSATLDQFRILYGTIDPLASSLNPHYSLDQNYVLLALGTKEQDLYSWDKALTNSGLLSPGRSIATASRQGA